MYSSVYFGFEHTVCWIVHDLLHNMTTPLIFRIAYSKPLCAMFCSCGGLTGVFIKVQEFERDLGIN